MVRNHHHPIVFLNYRTRLLFEIVMSLVFHTIITFTLFKGRPFLLGGLFFSTCIFIFISEGIFAFNKLLGRKYPWHSDSPKRFLFLILFAAFWFFITVQIAHPLKSLLERDMPLSKQMYDISLIFAILFVSIYVVMLIAYNYHQSLGHFRIENERLKQDKLKQDYRALQDQINPHFLFNNLSTLIAIIRQDQNAAVSFAENFSDVYRYVLKSKDSVSVKLKDELAFIDSYLALHKERLGDGLQMNINVDESLFTKELPVLSLQFLVENAIKHNVATIASPLKVEISTSDNCIIVRNNLNPKESTYSTNTGLDNLKKRIAFLTNTKMEIRQTDKEFVVVLPLI
ncbi:sensor histidine kinase [Carboxylicivirga sp. N1Y90]|uniref:sensor histidine kinase n=1 Tax=Carboxylicivirga fragile TaxID=3417571 RepID=UPI003D35897D|nr:histidine kinase [Marinilabiliaceae bacterium N1Y90]